MDGSIVSRHAQLYAAFDTVTGQCVIGGPCLPRYCRCAYVLSCSPVTNGAAFIMFSAQIMIARSIFLQLADTHGETISAPRGQQKERAVQENAGLFCVLEVLFFDVHCHLYRLFHCDGGPIY